MTYDNLRFCFIFLVLHHAGHWIVHSTTSDDDLDGQQHISTSEWTYDQVYWKGKEAYSENRWSECVALFTRAIQLHKRHRRDEAACRLKCHLQADNTELLIPEGPYVFFERAIWDTLCLTTCQKHPVATNRDVAATNRVIDQEFENLVPYDYLQMCYFKVSCAFL